MTEPTLAARILELLENGSDYSVDELVLELAAPAADVRAALNQLLDERKIEEGIRLTEPGQPRVFSIVEKGPKEESDLRGP